jgi:hypothetical protein
MVFITRGGWSMPEDDPEIESYLRSIEAQCRKYGGICTPEWLEEMRVMMIADRLAAYREMARKLELYRRAQAAEFSREDYLEEWKCWPTTTSR